MGVNLVVQTMSAVCFTNYHEIWRMLHTGWPSLTIMYNHLDSIKKDALDLTSFCAVLGAST